MKNQFAKSHKAKIRLLLVIVGVLIGFYAIYIQYEATYSTISSIATAKYKQSILNLEDKSQLELQWDKLPRSEKSVFTGNSSYLDDYMVEEIYQSDIEHHLSNQIKSEVKMLIILIISQIYCIIFTWEALRTFKRIMKGQTDPLGRKDNYGSEQQSRINA